MRALIVCIAVLPLAVAAPIPKGPTAFGAVVPADDLAKLPFAAAGGQPFALAVHLPATKFERGDPIPALFALKNRTDKLLPLDMYLHSTEAHTTAGNDCAIELREIGGERPSVRHLQTTRCGGTGTEVLANGYYAARGNVGFRAADEPLPVGEYELSWRVGKAESNAVRFSVVPRRLGRPAPEPPRTLAVWRLRPGADDEPFRWNAAALGSCHSFSFAHAFCAGDFGAYFPDVRDVPTERGGLSVSAKWDGGTVKVELASPRREFTELDGREPAVYLLIDLDQPAGHEKAERVEAPAKGNSALADDTQALPMRWEVRLSKDWRNGLGDGARVAVLVANREPRGPAGPGSQRVKEVERKQLRAVSDEARLKSGDWVVKSEWQPIPKPKSNK